MSVSRPVLEPLEGERLPVRLLESAPFAVYLRDTGSGELLLANARMRELAALRDARDPALTLGEVIAARDSPHAQRSARDGRLLDFYTLEARAPGGDPVCIAVTRWALSRGDAGLICGTVQAAPELPSAHGSPGQEPDVPMHLIVNNALDAVIVIDEAGRVTEWNPKAEAIFGWRREEVVGETLTNTIIPPEHRQAHGTGLTRYLATGTARILGRHVETVGLRRSGERFPVELSIIPLIRPGLPPHFSAFLRDITERKRLEDELRLAASVFDNSLHGIVITDAAGRILRTNAAFTRVTGYRADEVVGRNPRLLQSGRHDRAFYERLWSMVLACGHWEGEVWNRRRNGELYVEWLSITALRDAHGAVTHYIGVCSDITESKRSQERIRRLAHYDVLTDIPNRSLFHDRLQQALVCAQRERETVALLYVDLDSFKPINDTLGHSVGDALLRETARRLQGCVREADTVARLGGDEFAAILPGFPDDACAAGGARRVATMINASLASGFHIEGHALRIGASIGVALYPRDAASGDLLLQRADAAMYRAKGAGKNRFCFC